MTKLYATKDDLIVIKPEFFTLDELVEHFLWKDADIEDYKNIACYLSGTRVIFGSWIYTTRKIHYKGGSGNEYYVDPDSINQERIPLIKTVLQYLHQLNVGEYTRGRHAGRLENFIQWLNEYDFNVPSNVNEAKSLFREYTKYLQQIVKTHDPRKIKRKGKVKSFGSNVANKNQATVLLVLSEMFNVEAEMIKGMTETIIYSHNNSNSKDAEVNEEVIDETLSYCFQFFEQVADFCLEAKPFPYKINLLEHEALLVPQTPSQGNVITPFTGVPGRSVKDRYWDVERGALRDETEVEASVKNGSKYTSLEPWFRKNEITKAIDRLRKKQDDIKEANDNSNHIYRLELGLRAMKSYFIVLLDITGMNDSTLATLKWEDDDEYIEMAEEKGFRNIKRRANKEVLFKIQSVFMGSFRTFVKLRRFVLNGYECNTLFFTGIGEQALLSVNAAKGGYGNICNDALERVNPTLTRLGSQILRKNKKRWLMKRTKGQVFLVAAMMQHKPETGEQNYPHETRAESQNQIGDYLAYQHNIIMEMDDTKLTSAGGCDSLTPLPKSDSAETAIKPDCQKKMTCLFCVHYRIKPVTEEIRKVLSMQYVIDRHSILHARSQTHFDLVMGPILERIRLLIQTMVELYPQTESIIKEVKYEVYEKQSLHWYWEARLQLLWELGWV